MKYRIFVAGEIYPIYFKTKKEAYAFKNNHGGIVQHKIHTEWFNY